MCCDVTFRVGIQQAHRILRAGNLMSMAFPPLVEPSAPLSKQEVERYARHVLIPEVGMEGQCRLKNARVLVVGAGGLGSPALVNQRSIAMGGLCWRSCSSVRTSMTREDRTQSLTARAICDAV